MKFPHFVSFAGGTGHENTKFGSRRGEAKMFRHDVRADNVASWVFNCVGALCGSRKHHNRK